MFELTIQFPDERWLLGFALATVFSLVALRLGALAVSGALAAAIVGGLTYGLGGLPAAILLVAFFASSSLLSQVKSKSRKKALANFAKGDRRDWAQVAANGGMPVLALLGGASGLLATPVAWAAFAASLAAVNADTWATELGVLSKIPPRLITTGKSVPAGTSGAISLLGSTVALGAALFIGVLAWLLPQLAFFPVLVIATLAGFFGSLFDSYLGAMVQAIYYCPKCKKETERHPLHNCGTPTTLRRGWAWLHNDWVNFLSALAGALLASGAATFFM
ncbi:MAG: DUF92 domain-containing protein [Anaerolineales bacterium]